MALLSKARERGLGWLLRRIGEEWQTPTTKLGRRLRPAQILLRRWFVGAPRSGLATMLFGRRPRDLVFFYDFRVVPLTFDFATALCIAEDRRNQLGLTGLQVVFVPSRDDMLRSDGEDYEDVVGQEGKIWRLHNLLLPLCALVPSVRGVVWAPSRAAAAGIHAHAARIFPEGYAVSLPEAYPLSGLPDGAHAGRAVRALRAPRYALRRVAAAVAEIARGRRVVTIALRNYGFDTARNSNLEAWAAAADRLEASGHCVIVLPDIDGGGAELPAALASRVLFAVAVWNVPARMALCELADLNLGVNAGPMNLCLYGVDTRYAMFKLHTPGAALSSYETLAARGFLRDRDTAYAGPHQRLVWRDDESETILAVATEMLAATETEPLRHVHRSAEFEGARA